MTTEDFDFIGNPDYTIPNFSTNNPTDNYVVSVDGYFAYCNSLDEAVKIHNQLCDDPDGTVDITETVFDCAEIIHPHSIADNHQDPNLVNSVITDYKPCTVNQLFAYKRVIIANLKEYGYELQQMRNMF